MKKTQQKIIDHAIKLFNKHGVGNVRLQDISQSVGISAGNLSYHYKIKKDLMVAVLKLMKDEFKVMSESSQVYFQESDYTAIIKNYLKFQIGHRFFYRDILEIKNLVPQAKNIYERQMEQVLSFTKKAMYMAVDKGLIKAEPHDGHYHFFAKNNWAILNSWLIEREVLGDKKVSMEEVMLAIWESHYPYLTKRGKVEFAKLKGQLPSFARNEIASQN